MGTPDEPCMDYGDTPEQASWHDLRVEVQDIFTASCMPPHHTNTYMYNTITHMCMHGPTTNGTEVHNIITLFCIFTYSQTVFATPEEVCGRSLIAWLRETRRLKGLKREGRHLESGTSDVP